MSYKGIIQDGQIKLPTDAVLPEGASVVVDVEAPEVAPISDFANELLRLAKPRDWNARAPTRSNPSRRDDSL